MRRGWALAVLLLVILAGIAIGVGAYNAGVSHGLAQAREGGQVVRVVGPGYGFGFFPFGLFLFPLFLFLIFGLFRAAFWGRRWGGPGGHWDGPGHEGSSSGQWGKGRGAMFEEWHRRQHEEPPSATPDQPGPGGQPASV
jgi:hypothetical protein